MSELNEQELISKIAELKEEIKVLKAKLHTIQVDKSYAASIIEFNKRAADIRKAIFNKHFRRRSL